MEKRDFLKEVSFWIKVFVFVAVLALGAYFIRDLFDAYKESDRLVENTATIQKVFTKDGKDYVYLKYKVAAVYYSDMKKEVNKDYEVGEQVTIYYDPDNPFNVRAISFEGPRTDYFILMALLAMPAVFMAWIVARHIKKVKVHNYLADEGIIIKALVHETSKEETTGIIDKIKGRTTTYGLRCEAEYGGERCYFFKRGLYKDTSHLENVYVNVYVDPDNIDKYYIVPEPASESRVTSNLNYEELNKQVSMSTLSNDFEEFMNNMDDK